MPMAVGFNPALVGQPVMMNLGQPMMVRQTMMPSMIVANPSINPAAVQASRAAAAQQAHNIQNGIVQQQVPQEPQVGPPVTVFVGNISEKATDTLVRQILMKCGTVNNWKRVQGASGKLQAFGFCEFKEPDSALRALRLLQGYQLGDKGLLVKVDGNAQSIIEQWKKRSGIKQDSDGMDVLSTQVKNRDEAVRTELKTLLRDYHADLYVEDADQGQNIESKTDTSNTGGGEKPSESTSKTSKSEKSEKKVSEVIEIKDNSKPPSRDTKEDDKMKDRRDDRRRNDDRSDRR